MANDLESAVQMLKGILGDEAEEKIKTVMSGLGISNNNSEPIESEPIETQAAEVTDVPALPSSSSNMDGLQSIMKMKGMMDQLNSGNDSRSQLLLALKPYMRSTRQRGIDQAIRLLNLTKLTSLFK